MVAASSTDLDVFRQQLVLSHNVRPPSFGAFSKDVWWPQWSELYFCSRHLWCGMDQVSQPMLVPAHAFHRNPAEADILFPPDQVQSWANMSVFAPAKSFYWFLARIFLFRIAAAWEWRKCIANSSQSEQLESTRLNMQSFKHFHYEIILSKSRLDFSTTIVVKKQVKTQLRFHALKI